ncbi:hypothetical protein DPEC_G00309810 [Dallia pectoralis]|uniref:Uncharacterized protein n=1 Tax=Dallia pectoralis TaxID=75939 RepID=A0ACC2FF49_DALPE|nr:hypothetical protein DPEC_G00309810 [Dallia pectoralis]
MIYLLYSFHFYVVYPSLIGENQPGTKPSHFPDGWRCMCVCVCVCIFVCVCTPVFSWAQECMCRQIDVPVGTIIQINIED